MIPVFIAEHDDPEEALEQSEFKPVWDVMNALRAHDDTLTQELDLLRTAMGRGSTRFGIDRFYKIIIDLPVSVRSDFASALTTRLVEQTTSSWFFWYGLLERYAEQGGNASPAARFKTADGFALGSWVNSQRSSKDSLSEERVKLLEALPVWSWDLLEDRWNEAYEYLKAYVGDKGNARPAAGFKTADGFALGVWGSRQRIAKDSLSEERVKLLEALPGWSWDLFADRWE